ncbi:deoxyribose-phosphate aldolase [Aphanomyces astaci]|uniref:deoxyribose-phosphate aldolase n=1 Tax=Aphanomyces astaci TaxID=112090 RepID=W4HBK1_APHAT|nr:deoxyribose-phosphate aldolase [Aphanomyces astaci]ETV89390.1 deoxyribose-phosphate aldolase [Aphanomyces astaci]|eukprot:XP_009821790.1 deoxyribose-phosphate aldolase [Aphanomyces astaci]
MGRKRGAVWNEFVELPENGEPQMKMPRIECKHCKATVSKSSSRAVSHIRSCPKFTGELPESNDADDHHLEAVYMMRAPAVKDEDVKKFHPMSRMIDHTLLRADATADDVSVLCREALENGFYSVCVNGIFAAHARQVLNLHEKKRSKQRHSHSVKVCCVVGFPLGASTSEVKAFEAAQYIDAGAQEIDMVIAVGKLKGGDHAYVLRDISAVVAACKRPHTNAVTCKVILETALLTETEVEIASRLAISAGADFIKTSTGFSTRGASVHDVQVMARLARPHNVQVKASGGIRCVEDAQLMLHAGATRLGTSAGVAITKGANPTSQFQA